MEVVDVLFLITVSVYPRQRFIAVLVGIQIQALPFVCAAFLSPQMAHYEFYFYIDCGSLRLHGDWMTQAGFINGMPVKVRVMRDCIVITPQHTRELFGFIEGMSVAYINQKKLKAWLKTFPGALNDTGDIPMIKRSRSEGEI